MDMGIRATGWAGRPRSWHRAARSFNPVGTATHLISTETVIFTLLLKCSTLRPVDGWRDRPRQRLYIRVSGVLTRSQRYYLSVTGLFHPNSGCNDFATDT